MNRINLIQNHRIWLVAVFWLFVNVNMLAVSVGDIFLALIYDPTLVG